MINSTVLWREFNRDKNNIFLIIIETMLVFISVVVIKQYKIYDISYIYIPLVMTFIFQNNIFVYELTTTIEAFLSLPILPNEIIISKCVYVVVKTIIFTAIIIILSLLYNNFYITNTIKVYLSPLNILEILLLPLWQLILCYAAGLIIWTKGKKYRVVINIMQLVLYAAINELVTYKHGSLLIILEIICFLLLSIIIKKNDKYLDNETIISQALK